MIDADLRDRANAIDRDGRLIAWTPEAVGERLIEAYRVFDRTPMTFGPKAFGVAWPGIVTTWEDLVDDKERLRQIERYAQNGRDLNWEDWLTENDPGTKTMYTRDRRVEFERGAKVGAITAAHYSRAEESFRWCGLFLVDKPLLADAISTWAYCIGSGRSLRETLRNRAQVADHLLRHGRRHEERMPVIIAKRTGDPRGIVRRVTRQDVMPGKNFDTRLAWERRKIAASILCMALTNACVAFREAVQEPGETVHDASEE